MVFSILPLHVGQENYRKNKKNLGELHALMWVDMSLGTSCGFGFTRYVALITFLSLIPLFVSVVHYSDGGVFFFFAAFVDLSVARIRKANKTHLGFALIVY